MSSNLLPYPAALIFGIPGAGKGTQGEILTMIPGFFHLSSGVIFRKLDPKSEEGKTVRDYSLRGELVPDSLTIRVFKNWLEGQRAADRFKPRDQLLILDGIPRTVDQCEMFRGYIDVKVILHLECNNEDLILDRIRRRAILENRPDDANDSVTRRRLEVYRAETEPILNHYPRDIICDIESSGRPSEVLLECLKHLVPVLKEQFPR
jgi:adenylate kinase